MPPPVPPRPQALGHAALARTGPPVCASHRNGARWATIGTIVVTVVFAGWDVTAI